jgi:hypothetical protein
MAHPDHQVSGADREEDLGAVRDERDDAHGGLHGLPGRV